MSDLVNIESQRISLPTPNAPISVRLGTREDIPFIDALQKKHDKALGFFPRAQLEGYIDNEWLLIAEMNGVPVGYVASRDRYLKRDELGVIYQLCVSPNVQRGLIGASLIKAVFERSAYGCKLYCCWCAQDLAANKFWEALGFVPIAFRGGSAKKRVSGAGVAGRVHLFWQKRIRSNDTSTSWWFPAKTEGGAIREDRIVLPIPPGLHWSDPMPVMVSRETSASSVEPSGVGSPEKKKRGAKSSSLPTPNAALPTRSPRTPQRPGGMWFVTEAPTPEIIAPETAIVPATTTTSAPIREKKPKAKVDSSKASKLDPKLIAAARELRDRYLEQVNGQGPGASPMEAIVGKYDVSKAIVASTANRALAA